MPALSSRRISTGARSAILVATVTPDAARASEEGEDLDPVSHSTDGYYLDFSPAGKIELPRIFLVRRYLAMDVILPYVAWITLLAYFLDRILQFVSHRLFRWAHLEGESL